MKVTLKVMDEKLYNVISPDAEIETIVPDMHLTEGCIWDYKENRLIFNDIPVSNTMSWSEKEGGNTTELEDWLNRNCPELLKSCTAGDATLHLSFDGSCADPYASLCFLEEGRDQLFSPVYVNIIIAAALHFSEIDLHTNVSPVCLSSNISYIIAHNLMAHKDSFEERNGICRIRRGSSIQAAALHRQQHCARLKFTDLRRYIRILNVCSQLSFIRLIFSTKQEYKLWHY